MSVLLLAACSASKFVPKGQYLLEKVEIKSDRRGFDAASLEPYIRQKANSKWFSLFKIPMGTYALSGLDTTKWINRTLQKIGEEPVIFDSLQSAQTLSDLHTTLQNMGYMHSSVSLEKKIRGKKLSAVYILHPGEPYYIHSIKYDIQDKNIEQILQIDNRLAAGLKPGGQFTVDKLDEERNRITALLVDNGYYKFHKDYIRYSADSAQSSNGVNLTMH